MSSPTRRLAATMALAAALGVTACQPPPPADTAKAPPVAGRVAIAGDSLVIQAGAQGAIPAGWDGTDKAGLGWQAEHATPRLEREVVRSWVAPEVLVAAFGSNDTSVGAYGDGFTNVDRDQVRRLLLDPHPDATTVAVLPHRRGASGSRQLAAIDAYRAYVRDVAARNPRVCVTDWEPVYAPHRATWGSGDGTHFNPTGAAAYGRFLQDSVTHCTGGH